MQQEQHKNSFLGGFSLGLIAGAGAYFLFVTDKGKEVRKKANQYWQEAREELQEKGLLDKDDDNIKNFLEKLVIQFNQPISQTKKFKSAKKKVVKSTSLLKSTKSINSKSNKPVTKTSKRKFKGI